MCERRFVRLEYLRRHKCGSVEVKKHSKQLKSTTTYKERRKKREPRCDGCNKLFYDHSGLRKHVQKNYCPGMKTKSDSQVGQCHDTGDSVVVGHSSQLESAKEIELIRRKEPRCNECNKVFYDLSALQQHVKNYCIKTRLSSLRLYLSEKLKYV